MKSVKIACAIFFVHMSCLASDRGSSKSAAADRLKVECGYVLEEKVIGSVVSEEIKEGIFDSEKYVNFVFRINLKILEKRAVATLSFNCIPNGASLEYKSSLTPAQLIRKEDAGGRYFRNIAWQRRIFGRNWSGLIAYSDYSFGDGVRSSTYSYLICRAASPCFSFEIDPKIKLTSKEREAALDLLRKISFED